jgi:hypothetical protein
LNIKSEALLEWIDDPNRYNLYCDENLQLLKMEIYTGHIPTWLTEEDRKRFTAKRRRKIIAESEAEGQKGFSGRDSIKIFNMFYSTYAKKDKLINMSMLCKFFNKMSKELNGSIPKGFLDSLIHMYNYTVLQKVKDRSPEKSKITCLPSTLRRGQWKHVNTPEKNWKLPKTFSRALRLIFWAQISTRNGGYPFEKKLKKSIRPKH